MTDDRAALASFVRERVLRRLQEAHTGLKPSVARRAAQRIGLRLLSNWLVCWDPLHMGGVRASMVVEEQLRDRLGPLVDLACAELHAVRPGQEAADMDIIAAESGYPVRQDDRALRVAGTRKHIHLS